MSNTHVKELMIALIQSEATCKTLKELYLTGSDIDKEIGSCLVQFINKAPSLQILDIGGKGRDLLNFEI